MDAARRRRAVNRSPVRSPACRSCSRTSARSTRACRPPAAARWRTHCRTEHATVVKRWLDAGLVVFGKTNTPEFGAKGDHRAGAVRRGAQPVEPRPHPGRLVRRLGGGGRGRHRPGRRRQRRRRLDPHPGGLLRPVRPQGRPRADPVRPDRRRAAARRRDQRRHLAQRARQRRDARRPGRPRRDGALRPGMPDGPVSGRGRPRPWQAEDRLPHQLGHQLQPASRAPSPPSTRRQSSLESLGHDVEPVAAPFDDAALGSRLPEHLVRLRRLRGRRDQAAHRCRQRRLRARHADHGRSRPGDQQRRPLRSAGAPSRARARACRVPSELRPAADADARHATAAHRPVRHAARAASPSRSCSCAPAPPACCNTWASSTR